MNHKIRWIILASILLNVLLVGILFGRLPHQFDRESYYERAMDQAVKTVPQSQQKIFRQRLDQMRAQAAPIRDQIRQARDETLRIVTTDPFDEAAFDREVKRINNLRVQMAAILKNAAKELPPEQRHALGEALKRPSSAGSR
jgi:uncharacterized membrane protein